MKNAQIKLLILTPVLLYLCSCVALDNIGTIQMEILRPGLFEPQEANKTIAIINRDLYHSDTCTFKYIDGHRIKADTTINYNDLADKCVNSLEKFLEDQKYFHKVINFTDSMSENNQLIRNKYSTDEFFRKTGADVCVFLNYFRLQNSVLGRDFTLFHTQPSLNWLIIFKESSQSHLYNQTDTLNFRREDYPQLFKSRKTNPDNFLDQAALDMGTVFGSKLIPVWTMVSRRYYRSTEGKMRQAHKFAMKNDWKRAAEIWNKTSAGKNEEIAAQASFNMALVCEINGNIDLAIEWLNQSQKYKVKDSFLHQINCWLYIDILKKRQEEIKLLASQFREK